METREDRFQVRKSRKKKIIIGVILLTLVTGVAFGSWLDAAPSGGLKDDLQARFGGELTVEPDYGKPVNIMLVGSDARHGENARSDTLIVMRLDFDRNRVYLVSIPRDMRVYIPGRGNDKINAAYAYGHATLAMKTVKSFLGVDLNHYIEVDFKGFKRLVDTLGGIDITIDKPIIDRTRQFSMFIPKGPQHMNGEVALNYVRYRHGDSDFERAGRQQNFLRALAANTFRVKSIFKLPTLIGILDENVSTDLTKRRMLSLGGFMRRLPKDRIETITLPGRPTMIGGISYVEPDRAAANVIMDAIEAGRPLRKMKSLLESGKMSLGNKPFIISLLNGSGKSGLAGRAKSKLGLLGWRNVRTSDASRPDHLKTEIRYAPEQEAQAARIRRQLFSGAVMVPVKQKNFTNIEVILGRDYYGFERVR